MERPTLSHHNSASNASSKPLRPVLRRFTTLELAREDGGSLPLRWRFLVHLSQWMMLAGYLTLIPLTNTETKLRFPSLIAIVITSVLLAGGYSSSVLLCLAFDSWKLCLDLIFLPSLTISSLSLFAIFYYSAISRGIHWSTAFISAVALGGTSTIIYTILTFIATSRLHHPKVHRTPYSNHHNSVYSSPNTTPPLQPRQDPYAAQTYALSTPYLSPQPQATLQDPFASTFALTANPNLNSNFYQSNNTYHPPHHNHAYNPSASTINTLQSYNHTYNPSASTITTLQSYNPTYQPTYQPTTASITNNTLQAQTYNPSYTNTLHTYATNATASTDYLHPNLNPNARTNAQTHTLHTYPRDLDDDVDAQRAMMLSLLSHSREREQRERNGSVVSMNSTFRIDLPVDDGPLVAEEMKRRKRAQSFL